MSTPGDVRRPSTTKPSATATAADGDKKPGAAKTAGAKPGAGRPTGKSGGGGKNRKPVTPVKVSQGRNWGPIALFTVAGVLAVAIVGFGGFKVWQASHKPGWQDQAKAIKGLVNYRESDPVLAKAAQHEWGVLTFNQNPPVGGTHNYVWQNCMGDVYDKPIPKEQAVHSMEHGAVWVTYQPNLPADQVAKLAEKVKGKSYLLMSPYEGLDKPISLQAWGYQLKVDSASDARVDEFINALRLNATMEPGADCSGGITDTGTAPLDLGKETNPTPSTDMGNG